MNTYNTDDIEFIIDELNADDLNDIIDNMEPECIPIEFISAARVVTRTGERLMLSPQELETIMDEDADLAPEDSRIAEIKLLVNIEDLKETIKNIGNNMLKINGEK